MRNRARAHGAGTDSGIERRVVAARTVSEVPSPCALGEPDPEPRQSVAGTPDPDRRGSAGRRRHAPARRLVLISVLILPVSLLWAALYLAFGSPVGWVPLVYFAILLTAIVVFSRTGLRPVPAYRPDRHPAGSDAVDDPAGRLPRVRRGRPVGDSRAAPALVFSDVRTAVRWYVAYLVVFLCSGIAGELLGGVSPAVPEWFYEHDARSQRDGGRHDRVHAARRVRRPAPERARGVTR